MDWKVLLTIFGTVFLAELGDKTQLATVLFATRESLHPLVVFLGASLALIASSALGVAAGSFIADQIDTRVLSYIAGIGFILIGAWTIWNAG
ncbi:MAG: TMEM165/GDT1 family protein [Pseudomonadales bacterium]|jgi:putative Ca2+/H+ antiporter (TMEM165/GDT1 family)